MKLIKILFLILTLTVVQGKTQNILGKWYAFSDNSIGEFCITQDSIKIQFLNSRDDTQEHERQNIKHLGTYQIDGKQIIIIEDRKTGDESEYKAMTFFNIKERVSIELAANGITKTTKTIEELIDLVTKDTTRLFGNVFYHEDRINEFEKMKALETMPVEDFRAFLKTFAEKRDKFAYREKLMPGTFHEQMVNQTLIELGYNPIFRNDWENRFVEKYLSDKEVGEIYRQKF